MGLVEDIDEEIEDEPETYELAIGIACTAERYQHDPELGETARMIRDVFGTYAERIHGYGNQKGVPRELAIAAHDGIATARDDWLRGGRTDVPAFAARWLAAVGEIDTSWMQEPSTPNMRANPE